MAVDKALDAAKNPTRTKASVDELYPPDAPRKPVDEQPKVRKPGTVASGLSKALMQSAFSKFGQAFTDTGNVKKDAATRNERLAPYIAAGGEAASALENRWHTMEYDNFMNEKIEPWTSQKKQMMDDYQRRSAQADIGVFEGPDGAPVVLDVKNNAEDRLLAGRMTGQLHKRFYAVNADMDMELFNDAGKYEKNPMIVGRVNAIRDATANVLMTVANPKASLDAQDKQSEIRSREANAASQMVNAKANAQNTKNQKSPVGYREAIKHPDVGVAGIMQWFTANPAGLALMNAPGGGSSFVIAEEKIARGRIMADHPDLDMGDPRIDALVDKKEPLIMMAAAGKYLKQLDPAAWKAAQTETPQFFAKKRTAEEKGVVSDRQDPKVRQGYVDTWKRHAQNHFNEFMKDTNNPTDIDAAMDDLEQWLGAAVYGDTDEPELQAVTAARGQGTTKYVSEIMEQIPNHIKRWWASPDGSGIAKEENPDAARFAAALAGKYGRKKQRSARAKQARDKKKKGKGILP